VAARGHIHVATRTCVGCGKRDRQDDLLRVQLAADRGLQIVSIPGPGRSAYIHANSACHDRLGKNRKTGKTGLLARSLRREITEEQKQRVLQELHAQMRHALTNGLREGLS
jgi:predicted RNA-binding protein YlxR (DUF448 family)